MPQPAPRPRSAAPRPTGRPRTLALPPSLPPSLRRRARGRRLLAGAPSHAMLRAALRALLALPPESARDADRAVALIMRRVRADA